MVQFSTLFVYHKIFNNVITNQIKIFIGNFCRYELVNLLNILWPIIRMQPYQHVSVKKSALLALDDMHNCENKKVKE